MEAVLATTSTSLLICFDHCMLITLTAHLLTDLGNQQRVGIAVLKTLSEFRQVKLASWTKTKKYTHVKVKTDLYNAVLLKMNTGD